MEDRNAAQDAITSALRILWLVTLAVATFGFLITLGMKHVPMHSVTDEAWGLVSKDGPHQEEAKKGEESK